MNGNDPKEEELCVIGSGWFNQRLKIDISVNEREIKRYLYIIEKKVSSPESSGSSHL